MYIAGKVRQKEPVYIMGGGDTPLQKVNLEMYLEIYMQTGQLLDYQKPHVNDLIHAFDNGTAVIDASDTGTGKTYCAAVVAQTMGLRPLIVCPKPVLSTWIRVMHQFGVNYYGVSNYELLRCGSWYPNKTSLTKEPCPYINSTKHLCTWNSCADMLVIFDEAHKCKNPNTHNAKMLLAAKDAGIKILALSATIADKPEFFAVLATAIGLCESVKVYPIFLRKLIALTGMTDMITLHKRVFPHHGARMTIASLGDRFPKNLIIADTYFMGDDIAHKIQEQYEYIKFVAQEAKHREEMASCRLVAILRARQRIEALKVKTIIDMVEDHLNSGLSVAVFVNYLDTLRLLSNELKCKCFIHGGQKIRERDDMIDLFQSNKEKLIISTIQSGGVGISLHDIHGGHPRVSIISPSWSGQDLMQSLGRIHRAGAKTPCIQKLVYCQGTIEDDICTLVQKKLNNYSQFNDNITESNIQLSVDE